MADELQQGVDDILGTNTVTQTTTAPASGSNTWIIVTVVVVVLGVLGIAIWYLNRKK